MIKKFEQYEIDPYGEEDWNGSFIENLWNLIRDNNVFTLKHFYERAQAIEFSIDYPNGILKCFLIELDPDTEKFTLYSIPYNRENKKMILNEVDFKELCDAISYVVEDI